MKRDVLFMCQFFYPEFVSSAKLPYQTAKGLAKSGLSVDVLCGYPKEYSEGSNKIPRKEMKDDIYIYRKRYLQFGRKNFVSRLINYFSFTFSILLSLPRIRKYKVIIVYSNPPILPIVSIIAKKIFGCKIVFVSYDIYPEIAINTGVLKKDSLISKIMDSLNKSLFKNVSRVVSLSSEMKEHIVNNRDISADKVYVIPNWATESYSFVDIFKNDILKQIRSDYKLIISYFGNMGTAQDIETLVDVVKREDIQNSNIAFIFAGHGNKKEKLKQFTQENQLKNVYIFDYLKGDDFNEALSISDLFVVSLESDISGLAVPSKTYSYYQAGKPIIAIMSNDTDISKEIQQYQAGYSFKNHSDSDIAKTLLELERSEKSLLQGMEKNVKQLYEDKYKMRYQIDKYVNLIKSLLEE
ncbi:glycosyltransferase WbuB [Enterococcus casseliflavus]|uniref:glycosyltransferase family 4 protein n=1 Tax=Enterococcus casseliflavus TaxID=37734 RepID=UPI001AD60AAC|nr:glycosyltransferase family 4 protein [Enterococcus casseliflavus]MBO6357944.1 glycosyltransferase WbuB [Enterococcus casseliflavus]MBO6375590.1 glycosyltransferase WbuB [Enterococcus casseliflavus]